MTGLISYWLDDRHDGLFDVVVATRSGRLFRRDGLSSLAEVDDCVEELRCLMAAMGGPVEATEENAAYGGIES